MVTEVGWITAPEVMLAGGAFSSLLLRQHGSDLPQPSVRAIVAATAPLPQSYLGAAADEHVAFRARADGGYTLAAGRAVELLVEPDAIRALPKYLKQLKADPFGVRLLPLHQG